MVAMGGIAEHYIGASISLAGVNLADTYSPPACSPGSLLN
jgi:hypothetical protein